MIGRPSRPKAGTVLAARSMVSEEHCFSAMVARLGGFKRKHCVLFKFDKKKALSIFFLAIYLDQTDRHSLKEVY